MTMKKQYTELQNFCSSEDKGKWSCRSIFTYIGTEKSEQDTETK